MTTNINITSVDVQINSLDQSESSRLLKSYSKRDEKWDKHRSNTQSVGDIYSTKAKHSKLANRMKCCANWLGFGETKPDEHGEVKKKLVRAEFCHVRHCPLCQWRRSQRNTSKAFAKLPEIEAENPGLRWIFLTLTVKDPVMSDLRSTITEMNAAWKRLVRLKIWPAVGWLRSIEVTRDANGDPHPHFHIMMCVKASYFKGKGYIKQRDWLQIWRDAMRDQRITQVDVRVIKPKKDGFFNASVIETIKYAFKPADIMKDPAFLFGLTEQLHGMRFIATGGIMKGMLVKEKMSDAEMIKGDEKPGEIDPEQQLTFFKWNRVKRHYAQSSYKPGADRPQPAPGVIRKHDTETPKKHDTES